MNDKDKEKIITLTDLWNVFVSKLIIILLVSVTVTGVVFAYNTITFSPSYKSTATLYILRQNETGNDSEVKEDFSLALNVVNDCTYLLKSHAVLDKVIEELSLDIDYDTLSKSVTTNNPENTRILEVSVTSDFPKQSKRIVDSVCRIGANKIMEAMGFNQVNLYENGIINNIPYNRTGMMTYLMIGAGTILIMYLIFLIAFLVDDRIRSEEDIENYLGLSVLGDIPNAYAGQKNNKYGYYGKRKYKAYKNHAESENKELRYGKN